MIKLHYGFDTNKTPVEIWCIWENIYLKKTYQKC